MNKIIAITGINGFVGKHLTRELLLAGHKVIGVGQEEFANSEISNDLLEYVSCNLAESWPKFVNTPDAVIHLAGLAAVGPSFDKPQVYINLNSAMVTHMCESYVLADKKPRIVIVSSGALYDSTQPMPISEQGIIALSSPYAVSKILVENQAEYYRQRGLECLIVRPFNHIGPGQLPGFILPDFYKRISELDKKSTSIDVGNIDTKRDYTDVRDIVRAYTLIATQPKLSQSLFNVCSGKSLSGREILDHLKLAMGRPEIEFKVNPELVRPTDAPDIYGDSSLLTQETGWTPRYQISTTIADFVAAQR